MIAIPDVRSRTFKSLRENDRPFLAIAMKRVWKPAALFFIPGILLLSCQEAVPQVSTSRAGNESASTIGEKVNGLGKDIGQIFQDKQGVYWFASNGDGVYRYDGKHLSHITEKDGLACKYVRTIQEDTNGHLWFTTGDGVYRFDGNHILEFTQFMKFAHPGMPQNAKGCVFFNRDDDVCLFDGNSWTAFSIYPSDYHSSPSDNNRPYSIYSTLADRSGNVWFGTESKGVCRYDGKSFTYLTEKDLSGPAVRTIFEDRSGNLWFGNNGGGLYRYDGKTLANITEEKGLGNPDFLKGHLQTERPGTLARVWSINQDTAGNIWIGTIDCGLWKYDGTSLRNYTIRDGLTGNSIWTIFKDRSGELWFVANGKSVCRYDGKKFYEAAF